MLIFSVMIIIPLLSYETYWSEKTSYDSGIDMIYTRYKMQLNDTDFFVAEFAKFHLDERAPIANINLYKK